MLCRMSTHVIGDVHGCYRELCTLLERLELNADDRLIFVGDLIIRGPENSSVFRLVSNLPNTTVILGNNEAKLRPTLDGDPTYRTPAVLAAIDELDAAGLLGQTLDYIEALPLAVDLGDRWIVHAGVRPGVPLAEQTREDLINLKTLEGTPDGTLWWNAYLGPATVLFGHHVVREPVVMAHSIAIDTGCVYGGSLTALTLETMRFTTVRAEQTYYYHPSKASLFV
jgi:hypothetical protein